MDQDYYQILGIHKHATAKEIRNAYYKQSQFYHPDKNRSPEAKEMFLKVQRAYKTLSDPNRRRVYDDLSAAEFEKWDYSRQNPQPPRWSSWFDCFAQPQKPDESAQLTVHFEGKVYEVSANLSDKIVNTKFTLAAKTSNDPNNLRLFFGGVELKDEQKNHKFYRIPKVATLDAVRKLPPNNRHARPTSLNAQNYRQASPNAYRIHSTPSNDYPAPIVDYPDSPNAYPAPFNNRPAYIILNNDYPTSPNSNVTPIIDYPDSPNAQLNSNIDYTAFSNVHSPQIFEYPSSPTVHHSRPFNEYSASFSVHSAPINAYPVSHNVHSASVNVHSTPFNAYPAPVNDHSASVNVHSTPFNAYPAPVNDHLTPVNAYPAPVNDHLAPINVCVTNIYPTLPNVHSVPTNDHQTQNYNYSAPSNDFQRPIQKTHTYL